MPQQYVLLGGIRFSQYLPVCKAVPSHNIISRTRYLLLIIRTRRISIHLIVFQWVIIPLRHKVYAYFETALVLNQSHEAYPYSPYIMRYIGALRCIIPARGRCTRCVVGDWGWRMNANMQHIRSHVRHALTLDFTTMETSLPRTKSSQSTFSYELWVMTFPLSSISKYSIINIRIIVNLHSTYISRGIETNTE